MRSRRKWNSSNLCLSWLEWILDNDFTIGDFDDLFAVNAEGAAA